MSHQQCPAPRPSSWAAIKDTVWPLIAHHEGDDAWAHLEPAGLPGQSATWCNPLEADTQAVRAGGELYSLNCAQCHGDQGKGNGPGGSVLNPEPYDFTRPAFAGMRQAPGPAVLYAIITRGIDGTGMRGYGNELSGWERLALMAYIGRFPGDAAIRARSAWADSLHAHRHP